MIKKANICFIFIIVLTFILSSCNNDLNYDEKEIELSGMTLKCNTSSKTEISTNGSSAFIYLDDDSYCYFYMDEISSVETIKEYNELGLLIAENKKQASENIKATFYESEDWKDIEIKKETTIEKFKDIFLYFTKLSMNDANDDTKFLTNYYETVVDGRHTIFALVSTAKNYNNHQKAFEKILDTIEFKDVYDEIKE